MNYFSPESAAERYAKGRPLFHENTMKHIQHFLNLDQKMDAALDVACGTGLSTKALLEIAHQIYGTDTSSEMLKWALEEENIQYSIAAAEALPFPDQEFDVITVSSGVHWFHIDKFLVEAARLLKNDAWLVLYDNYFISEMDEVPEFKIWFPEVYSKKFPSPPRNEHYDWSKITTVHKNLRFIEEEQFKNSVLWTKADLILYFTTQSNITAVVESGDYKYDEIEHWLDQELSQFFETDHQQRTIYYGNWIKYIQRKH